MPFFFFIKEFFYKFLYILNLLIIFWIYTYLYFKIILLFLLNPIKIIKFNQLYYWFWNTYNIYWYESWNEIQDSFFLPVIEINLPFFTTSYWYVKFFFLFSIYIFMPVLFYYLFLIIKPLLKKNEIFFFCFHWLFLNLFWFFNYIIHHFLIIQWFLQFTFSHYHEFLYYEFDIEFQILFYLNLYFKLLYYNILIYIAWWIKYQWIDLSSIWIYLILLFLMPPDLWIQIIYIIWSFFIKLQIKIYLKWSYYIKIYKHKEYVVKH
jgi:hypothetical protein